MCPSINLDLITSDQYAQVYLDHLFSDEGPVAELEKYFNKASDYMKTLVLVPRSTNKTGMKNAIEQSDGVSLKGQAEGVSGETQQGEIEQSQEKMMDCSQREESLKLSIVETQPEEKLNFDAAST